MKKIFLSHLLCNGPVKKERTDGEVAVLSEQNMKAMNYTCYIISNNQIEFIDEETTAFGNMKKLTRYWKKSSAL